MRSLPSLRANTGSLCLPVTFHGSFFFLLHYILYAIFNEFIENRVSPHNVQESKGVEAEIPSLNGSTLVK